MRSLCTCAALAVATAFAQGHFAEAFLRARSNTQIETTVFYNDPVDCSAQITKFRRDLLKNANAYELLPHDDEPTDLEKVLEQKTCEGLKSGKFDHLIHDDTLFAITASRPAEDGVDEICEAALKQWKNGVKAFNGEHPQVYKNPPEDSDVKNNPYANPDAAALVSLLQTNTQKMVCGKIQECEGSNETKLLLCYFKFENVEGNPVSVDPDLWRALEIQENIKPKLEKKNEKNEDAYLNPVNAAREAVNLEKFAVLKDEENALLAQVLAPPYSREDPVQGFLYNLTCKDISNKNIGRTQPEGDFTVIYYIKDAENPPASREPASNPSLEDAVKYWETGFAKLEYKRPPAFKKKGSQEAADSEASNPAVEASKIYDDSATAGYAAIMADGPQAMACVEVSGCGTSEAAAKAARNEAAKKPISGLICVIHKAVLKEDVRPISQKTWIEIMKKQKVPIPAFTQLEASKNCLEEMNAVRTQEKLGLKPFVTKAETPESKTELALSSVMEGVTCKAIGAADEDAVDGGLKLKITDDKTSLMYHTYTGDDKTCSAAVEAWKKGSEKFTAAPPAYSAKEKVYEDAAATNFVSLISEGEKTVTCYATNCAKEGIVCELSPAALVETQTPVSEALYTKYMTKDPESKGGASGQPESSGVAGFSKAALTGTVVMTLAAGVFFV